MPPVRKRDDIAREILEPEQMRVGVELGVRQGEYAAILLKDWPACELYVLVDLWAQQDNYLDGSNRAHDRHYAETQAAMRPYQNKVAFCRNYTTACASEWKHAKFDFAYVDARHDYKGVMEDLLNWWPLVRENGIMAGHDFVEQDEGPTQTHQNWTVNFDGTVDASGRAVRGAVVDFFNDPAHPERYRQIYVTYQNGGWWTWIVRK